MKKLFLFFALGIVLSTVSTSAKEKGSDTISIDKQKYRIVYNSRIVSDTTRIPYRYREGQSHLDIGENGITRYYSHTMELWYAAVKEMLLKENVIDLRRKGIPRGDGMDWEIYYNYPEVGKSTFLQDVTPGHYQCIEDIETPAWELVSDSTATIMGYACQLAVANFKGRTWYAWYAEDIPLDNGPWKLRGLPGLILRAYDSGKQYEFTASGMTTCKDDTPITFVKKVRETVSQKDLYELQEKKDLGALLVMGAKVQDEKGKDITKEVQRKGLNHPPFNNIERF